MSRGTQDTRPPRVIVLDGTLTLSGHAFQRVGVIVRVCVGWSYNPSAPLAGFTGLGSSRFARHYYGNLV